MKRGHYYGIISLGFALLSVCFMEFAQANQPPNLIVIVNRTTGPAPLDVEFDATQCSDPDGHIVAYLWDFGDGEQASEVVVAHTFENGGQFTVRLTVTDNGGISVSSILDISVAEREIPLAAFSYSIGKRSLEIAFDARYSKAKRPIVTYEWDFGDGSQILSCKRTRRVLMGPKNEPSGIGPVPEPVPAIPGGPVEEDPKVPGGLGTRPPGTQPATDGLGRTPGTQPSEPGGPGTRPPGGTTPTVEECPISLGFSHTYAAPGLYAVKLKVTDQAGASDEVSRSIKVFRNIPLTEWEELKGVTGGTPSSTSVAVSNLSTLGVQRVRSLLIRNQEMSPGQMKWVPPAPFAGLKLDAIFFSTTKCRTAPCAAFLPQDSNYASWEASILPGVSEPLRRLPDAEVGGGIANNPTFFGVTGNQVDNTIATLDVIDANASRNNPQGFLTLGYGGALLLRYPTQSAPVTELPVTQDMNLYVGLINEENVEASAALFEELVSMEDVIDMQYANVPPDENQSGTAETAFFDVNGGEHTYPNGITLKLPPGALTEGKDISIRNLDTVEMASLLSIRGVPEQDILFAFAGEPDDLRFEKPVTVKIPVEKLTPVMIPLITHVDLSDGSASVANASYIADPDHQTIELTIDHFTGYEAEIIEEIQRHECTDESTTNCRCGTIQVTQTDNDYSCSRADCQVTYSENWVKFLDCPSAPEESSIFEEVSAGCIPALTMESNKIYLEPGEQSELTARIKLGCAAPMERRNVAFSVTGPGTVSPVDNFTDEQGMAATTLTAGSEEGTVTVTGESSFTYYTKRINVNGTDLVSEQQTADLVNSVDVYVIKKPVLTVSADDEVIAKNEMTAISATITDHGIPVEGRTVYFSVIGPADITPFSSVTSSSGRADALLSAHDSEGSADVMAESEVRVLLPNGDQVQIPVSGNVTVAIIGGLEGSVWQFESSIETTKVFNPIGCEDVYVQSRCSCTGDYTGIMLTERSYQRVTGRFTLSRSTPYSSVYSGSFSDIGGSLQIDYPSSEYSTRCPLGGGLGGPGCACEDPNFIRIDGHGYDGINEVISFLSPAPNTNEIEAFAYGNDNSLDIRFHRPGEPAPVMDMRTWYSCYSDCSCLGWDGHKSYHSWPSWEFASWVWRGSLENGQWSETSQEYNTTETTTFTLECVSNCNE